MPGAMKMAHGEELSSHYATKLRNEDNWRQCTVRD